MFHGWLFKAKGLLWEHSLEECARLLPCKFAYGRPLSPVSIRRECAIEIDGVPGLHFGVGLLAFMLPAVYRPIWMIGSIGGIWGQLRFDLWSCDRSLWGLYWSANLLLSFISAQCYWVLLKIPKYLKKKRWTTGKTGWPGVMNNRFFGSFMKSKFMFKGVLYLGSISDEAGIWDSCLNDAPGTDPTGHCLWHCLH